MVILACQSLCGVLFLSTLITTPRAPIIKLAIYFLVILSCIYTAKHINYDLKNLKWGDQLRVELWKSSIAMIKYKPVGYGPGGFEKEYPKFKTQWTVDNGGYMHYPHPMNETLYWATDFGIVGGILFLVFSLLSIFSAFYFRKNNNMLFAVGVSLAGLFAHSQIDLCLQHPPLSLFFFMLAGIIHNQIGEQKDRWTGTILPYAVSMLGAAAFLIFLLVCPLYQWKAWHENVMIRKQQADKIPITVLGKYALLASGDQDAKLVQQLIRYAPHFRQTDFLIAVYLYQHGNTPGAKVYMSQYKKIYRITDPAIAEFDEEISKK